MRDKKINMTSTITSPSTIVSSRSPFFFFLPISSLKNTRPPPKKKTKQKKQQQQQKNNNNKNNNKQTKSRTSEVGWYRRCHRNISNSHYLWELDISMFCFLVQEKDIRVRILKMLMVSGINETEMNQREAVQDRFKWCFLYQNMSQLMRL